MHQFLKFILFWNNTLHVSEGLSFYHLASVQATNLCDIDLLLYVQSWTPDDERKDRPKHVEFYSKIK